MKLYFFSIVIALFLVLFSSVSKADYTVCNDDGPAYKVTYIQVVPNGTDCVVPSGCYIHVGLGFRETLYMGQMRLEFVIYNMFFVGPCSGLSQECKDNITKLAMMGIAQDPYFQIKMGLLPHVGTYCYDRAFFKIATCWQYGTHSNPIRIGWEPCDSECCEGRYRICRNNIPNTGSSWSIERLNLLQNYSDNCVGTCEFFGCESSMPSFWDDVGTFEDVKDISGWTPKSSILDNQLFDKKINISPSPTDDYVNIQFSGDKSSLYNLKVLNNNGETVYSQENISFNKSENQSIRFNASQLSSGLYLVQLIGNQGDFRYDKFIISK